MVLLEDAYAGGFRDGAFLRVDPCVAVLASEPRFVALLERIERDLRQQRARTDLRDLDAWAKPGKRGAAAPAERGRDAALSAEN